MVATIVRGQNQLFDAYFYEDDGTTPLFAVGGVSYVVTAFNSMLIASGIAEQDTTNLARWKLNLIIPPSAPTTGPNDVYTLVWRAKDKSGNTNIQRDKFTVSDQADVAESLNSTTIAMVNQPFNLSFAVNDPKISSLSLRILKIGSDMPLITLPNLLDQVGQGITSVTDGNLSRYNILISGGQLTPIVSQGNQGGLSGYFAYYNYLDGVGREQTQINNIYIVNSTILSIMNDMNMYCNMLRNADVVTQLQIDESKLVHFAIQGLQKVNATSPGNFGFDFNSLALNQTFYHWVVKCAQLELLQALSLAEGMSAFEFSGMTVQLNSDRTQYLNNAIGELQNAIDNQLPRVKSQFGRAGGGTGRMGNNWYTLWSPILTFPTRLVLAV